MAFPLSPVDGELYTNALGTQYRYVASDTAWKIINGAFTGVKGTGTAGYLAKFSDSTTIADGPFNVTGTQSCLLSTYRGTSTDGSNIYIGGGGQDSTTSGASTLGSYNISLGPNALNNVNVGLRNVAIGHSALAAEMGGRSNVAVGFWAAKDKSSGDYNTIIGGQAGILPFRQGSNNVYIGYGATTKSDSDGTANFEIVIGSAAPGHGSNTTTIGCLDVKSTKLGNVEINTDCTSNDTGWTQDIFQSNLVITGHGTLDADGTVVIVPQLTGLSSTYANRVWHGKIEVSAVDPINDGITIFGIVEAIGNYTAGGETGSQDLALWTGSTVAITDTPSTICVLTDSQPSATTTSSIKIISRLTGTALLTFKFSGSLCDPDLIPIP